MSAFFFCLCFILTSFVVLNLIIPIVLEQFELSDSHKRQLQRKEVLHTLAQQKVLILVPALCAWIQVLILDRTALCVRPPAAELAHAALHLCRDKPITGRSVHAWLCHGSLVKTFACSLGRAS